MARYPFASRILKEGLTSGGFAIDSLGLEGMCATAQRADWQCGTQVGMGRKRGWNEDLEAEVGIVRDEMMEGASLR